MKVVVTVVGSTDRRKEMVWPEGWPIPRVGDWIRTVPLSLTTTHIRHVTWMPEGEKDNPEPYVHLVIGPAK